MPFRAHEIRERGGVYYGQNVISKNLIIANRKELLNGNGFVLGVSGSGKSFTAKREMVNLTSSTEDDIIVVDPESEYRPLIEVLGGEAINISAVSSNHINALDMEQGDGENPVVLKSEFLLSLCEQLVGSGHLSAKEKSIIDRCTAQVYHDYICRGYRGNVPTLQDFHAQLLQQPEPEARDVALAIELFTAGSLNIFAKPTNVDTNSRILCYDIRDLGKQLLPVGMLVVLDSIFNQVIRNRSAGKNTWIYIDEIYLLFQHEYSANFLFTLWKRVRKYGACCSGLTQNVDDLLQSHTARTMLANSEFLVMLNQAGTDREELARLLNTSDDQLPHITNRVNVQTPSVEAGEPSVSQRIRTQLLDIKTHEQVSDIKTRPNAAQIPIRSRENAVEQVQFSDGSSAPQKSMRPMRTVTPPERRCAMPSTSKDVLPYPPRQTVQTTAMYPAKRKPVQVKECRTFSNIHPKIKGKQSAMQSAQKKIKIAEHSERTAVKTAGRAAPMRKHLQQTRQAVHTTEAAVKQTAESIGTSLKAIGAALQVLVSVAVAGGGIAIIVVLIICLIGFLLAGPLGMFLSGELSSGPTISDAIVQINGEFSDRIEQIKEETAYDSLDLDNAGVSVALSNWKNVLAVYAVRFI